MSRGECSLEIVEFEQPPVLWVYRLGSGHLAIAKCQSRRSMAIGWVFQNSPATKRDLGGQTDVVGRLKACTLLSGRTRRSDAKRLPIA